MNIFKRILKVFIRNDPAKEEMKYLIDHGKKSEIIFNHLVHLRLILIGLG